MRYADQAAVLTDLTVEASPERYDLCGAHADRTRPPRGWSLDDDRSDDVVVPVVPQGPRSVDDTVALLAAALHDDRTAEPYDTPAVVAPLRHDLDDDQVAEHVDELADSAGPDRPADEGDGVMADEPLFSDAAEVDAPSAADTLFDAAPSASGRRVPAAGRDGR